MDPARCTLLVLTSLALIACQSGPRIESDMGIEDAPAWVNQGTQALSNNEGRLIQGVGMAPAMGDESLQRATADNRARAELARVLSVYVESTLKDYSKQRDDELSSSVKRRLQSETRQVLNGSRILARWKHPESGDVYSFSQLNMDSIEKTLQQSEALNEGFSAYLEEQPRDFEQLVQDEEG